MSSHCYGVAFGDVSGIIGDAVTIEPSCLSTPSRNFVNDEVWLVDANAEHWIEVGFVQLGSNLNYGGITTAGRYGYWGDLRPGSNYFAHVLQNNPPLSPGVGAQIQTNGKDSWASFFNGHEGTSTGNTMTPAFGEYGSETSSASAHSVSIGDNAVYQTASGWSTGVPGEPGSGYTAESPETFSWQVKYNNYFAGVQC
ncbi:MAG: hypothetical protein ACRDRJ_32535 [Streptosporangiaceae bacterium]